MIVVEGPDGSGKTSLVKKLTRDLGIPVADKAIGSDAQALDVNIKRWVESSLDRGWHPTLYDRHGLISEGIYGPAWNGSLREPYNDLNWLQTAHARWDDLKPTVIVCLPPIEEVVRNIRQDPHNDLLYPPNPNDRHARVPKSVGQIYYAYEWYCAKNLNVFQYDYTIDEYTVILGYCQAMMNTRGVHA